MKEDDVQRAIVNYARRVLPPPWFVFAVPNKTPRGPSGKAVSGCPGFTKGVSDLIFFGPSMVICVEVKRPKTEEHPEGRLSPEQEAFLNNVRRCGKEFHGCVMYGIDCARNTFKALGITTRESVK